MRVLIAEDDSTSRSFMRSFLEPYGDCDLALNGAEAVDAFKLANEEGKPYDLICMDVMMPEMDGITALKAIRDMEKAAGVVKEDEVKVVMTTALDSPKDVIEAYYRGGCTDYLTKPIDRQTLIDLIKGYGLIG
ncbi:MAG: response regulator [Candidatus Magnetominusculus sp. LBB02]|nr:response regulator [Candidatus Magnetominusculus sp. LBB02]